jgi:pimeloyl-ACP methyl ester carboxylesterase
MFGDHRMMKFQLSVIVTVLIFTGCSSKTTLFVQSIVSPVSYKSITFEDNASSLYYTLHKGKHPKTVIFFIPGSGYSSLQYYFKEYFKDFHAPADIYALQKRHIQNRTTGLLGKPKYFDRDNTFTQWITDQKYFIHTVLNSYPDRYTKVILLGISEGATVAVKLSLNLPQVTHLAILGGGAYAQGKELRILYKNQGIDFDTIYADIHRHPHSLKRNFLGHPYRYWSPILSVEPMRFYEQINIPVLAAIGEKDQNTPVESARFLKESFQTLNKKNLTYLEYSGCDHFLNDADGINHKKEFFDALIRWSNIF